jgi:hypothetical protein
MDVVAASHVGRGGEAGVLGLVLTVEHLNLTKEIIKGCTWVGIDSGAKVVVVAAESMENIVDELVVI